MHALLVAFEGTQLQDWDAKRKHVLRVLSVAIRLCYSELLTLKLEHLCHFDFSWERESLECMPGLTCKGEPLLVSNLIIYSLYYCMRQAYQSLALALVHGVH